MKVGTSLAATTTFKQSVCKLTIRRIDRNKVIEKHSVFESTKSNTYPSSSQKTDRASACDFHVDGWNFPGALRLHCSDAERLPTHQARYLYW